MRNEYGVAALVRCTTQRSVPDLFVNSRDVSSFDDLLIDIDLRYDETVGTVGIDCVGRGVALIGDTVGKNTLDAESRLWHIRIHEHEENSQVDRIGQ